MKYLRVNFLYLMSAAIFFSCTSVKNSDPLSIYAELDANATPNTLTKKEKKAGWQILFDGKNIHGWHGYNMQGFPDSWAIEDGSFTMTTEGMAESQDIVTDKTYKNFALSLEFKLTKGANSGVIFQVAEDPKYKFPYETGPEFQVIDHNNWPDSLANWQKCGANYAMYPPKITDYKPFGEWNRILLVVNGNHVTQILNGSIVVEYDKYSDEWKNLRESGKWASYPDYGKFDEGCISLQNHGSKVYYRNIKIKEI